MIKRTKEVQLSLMLPINFRNEKLSQKNPDIKISREKLMKDLEKQGLRKKS